MSKRGHPRDDVPIGARLAWRIEGFLHQTNALDTLGDDQPESTCHLNR